MPKSSDDSGGMPERIGEDSYRPKKAKETKGVSLKVSIPINWLINPRTFM
jgi:hypothetical protein